MPRSLLLLAGLLMSMLLLVPAQPLLAADSALIRQAVDEFLRTQIKNLPGKAKYSVGSVDADRLAGVCDGFDVSMANGAPPWGQTRVVVACRGGTWALQVQVQIHVEAVFVVAARPIEAGQKLTEADVRGQVGELPNGVLTDKEQAIGRIARAPIATGRPLRADLLRQATVVQQGQSVRVIGTGSGFQVSSEGRAIASAVVGQVTQVRLNSGQIVSGVVLADGSVEIRF